MKPKINIHNETEHGLDVRAVSYTRDGVWIVDVTIREDDDDDAGAAALRKAVEEGDEWDDETD